MIMPYQKLDDDSRVWIFQSNTTLTAFQAIEIKSELVEFLHQWTAHSAQLYASGEIFNDRFVVVMVDEKKVGASGCSIDKLTHFIEFSEHKYGITLLDRMSVAYEAENNIEVCHLNDLPVLMKEKIITEDTLVFNNLVKTKADFDEKWKVHIKDSWHKRFL